MSCFGLEAKIFYPSIWIASGCRLESKDAYPSIWIVSEYGMVAKIFYPSIWDVSCCGLEAKYAYPDIWTAHGCRLEAKAAYASILIVSGSGKRKRTKEAWGFPRHPDCVPMTPWQRAKDTECFLQHLDCLCQKTRHWGLGKASSQYKDCV